jgi:hypothetical protein
MSNVEIAATRDAAVAAANAEFQAAFMAALIRRDAAIAAAIEKYNSDVALVGSVAVDEIGSTFYEEEPVDEVAAAVRDVDRLEESDVAGDVDREFEPYQGNNDREIELEAEDDYKRSVVRECELEANGESDRESEPYWGEDDREEALEAEDEYKRSVVSAIEDEREAELFRE